MLNQNVDMKSSLHRHLLTSSPMKLPAASSSVPPASRWPCRGSTLCPDDGTRRRRRRTAATDGLHLHAAGLLPGQFLPERDGQELRALAVPGSAQGVPRRFHGHLRVVAGMSGRPPGDRQLSDRRAGSRPARLSQRDLARSVRGRAHRRPDALPQPGPLGRRAWPVVDPDRCARAGGTTRRRGCSPRCSSRGRPTKSGPRCAASKTAAASSTTSAIRPSRSGPTRRRRSRQARRVPHQRPRAGAAARHGREMVSRRPSRR